MRLSRRTALHAAWLLVPSSARATGGLVNLTALPRERVLVRLAGVVGAVSLPAVRCRLLGTARLGGSERALVAFGAATGREVTCDVLAVIGDDGAGLRLLALELLSWSNRSGAHLATRPHVVPDDRRLLLAREAAAPRRTAGPGILAWRREDWTDLLAWRVGAPMDDARLRAPLPGTWQASLAATRAAVRQRLAQVCTAATEELVALAAASPLAGT